MNTPIDALALSQVILLVVQGLKGFLSEEARTKWTVMLALGIGVVATATWMISQTGIASIITSQGAANTVLQGIVNGAMATGIWHALDDLKPKAKE